MKLLEECPPFLYAEASLLAPYTYTAILWATLTGWIFWNELPTLSVILGSAVVIGSNLAIGWRERRRNLLKGGLFLPH